MSYVSLLRNIPDFLTQPAGIAALASVGIHGAIAFLLPLVPVDSSKPEANTTSAKTVGLLELNQAEQNRLPQTPLPANPTNPQLSLPSIPQQPQVPPLNFAAQPTPLPPLPPMSGTQVVLPPLPQSPDTLPVASLPKSQPSRILPRRDFQVDSSFNARTATAIRPFPRFEDRIRIGEPIPLPSSDISEQEPEPLPPSGVSETSSPLPPSNLPEVEAAKIPPELANSPSSLPIGTHTAIAPQAPELIAPVNKQVPQASDNLTFAGQQLPSSGIQAVPIIPNTTSQETQLALNKTATFAEQFAQVRLQYPNLETKRPISAILNATGGQEARIEGALVLNSDNQVEYISFLDNSVSSNQKTEIRKYFREYFQKNPVEANNKPKYYPFSISFKSDANTISAATLSDSQRSLIERLRSPKVKSPTSSNDRQVDLSQKLRAPEVSPQTVQESQTVVRQSSSTSQSSQRQLSEQHTVVKQSSSTSQSSQQQVSEQRTVVKQSSSAPQLPARSGAQQLRTINNSQSAESPEKPQLSNNRTASSIDSSKQLIQQLRQVRDQRQQSEQDKAKN